MMIGSTVFYHKKKTPSMFKLNLVALMDIFTILVFFLLLNTGESQKIENAKFINLPDAVSGIEPSNQLLIYISKEKIWLADKEIVSVEEVMKAPDALIEPLNKALLDYKSNIPEIQEYEKRNGLSVTIMGDKTVSYELLKSIMVTCQESDFRDISLAVNQVVSDLSGITSSPVEGGQ
jgi:biopolymer transport protein ExbD